jgi:aminoglycoside 3-N-acetyltransferase
MTGEHLAVAAQAHRARLAADLRSLGLRRGQDLLVHCSMRRLGPVVGGAATLLAALRDVATHDATIVVPAHTAGNSLTSRTFRAVTTNLNQEEHARYVANMPGFDPASTPSAGMGAFAEHVRTHPEARRSAHPQSSFAAVGPVAAAAMAVHDLDCHLGERSPLRWLYDADAAIVMLGVGYAACTAFHLAEYRLPGEQRWREYHCFIGSGTARTEHRYTDIDLDDSDFEQLGAALDAAVWRDAGAAPRRGRVGMAACTLMRMRSVVDFARSWMAEHRRLKI